MLDRCCDFELALAIASGRSIRRPKNHFAFEMEGKYERDGSRGRLVPASDLSVSFYWLVLVVRAVVLVIGGREYFPNVGPTVPRDLDQLGMETDRSFCSGPNPPLVTSRVGSGRPS